MDERGGGVSRFSVGNLSSHGTEKIRWTLFYASENFWYRKMLGIKGEGEPIPIFRRFFCFTVPKFFVEDPLVFH